MALWSKLPLFTNGEKHLAQRKDCSLSSKSTVVASSLFHQQIIQLIEKFEIEKLCDLFVNDDFLWKVKGTSQLSNRESQT